MLAWVIVSKFAVISSNERVKFGAHIPPKDKGGECGTYGRGV